jgi:hypothetical protein
MAERVSGIERRSSLQLPQQQQQQLPGPHKAATAAAGAASAAAAAAAVGGAADVSLQDTDMIDYKLGMQVSKLRWEVRGTVVMAAGFSVCLLYAADRKCQSCAGR